MRGKRWVCHKKRLCRGVRAWLLEKGVFDGARAVQSVFLTVRGRCEVFFLTVRGQVRSVFFDGARARCGAGENARAGMAMECEMGRIRF